jgi:quercetin dioxygenase-like cupin family protein
VSLQTNGFSAGKLSGVIYDFPEAGDVLPMHSHGETDVHITIVARGRVRAEGPQIGSTEYASGAVIDWPVGIEHEITGIDPGARIVNIIKGGA